MASQFQDMFNATVLPLVNQTQGQTVTHYPGGLGSGESIDAYGIDLEDEARGQGDDINTPEGRHVQRHGEIKVLNSVAVVFNDRGDRASQFDINGERWFAMRPSGRDPSSGGLQVVIVRLVDPGVTRQTKV